MDTDTTVRYFESFSATSYPIEPVNEIDLESARELVTYYEARYNADGSISQFIKYLKQQEPGRGTIWKEVFIEDYAYYATGRLKERRFSVPGGEPQVWRFDDEPRCWSAYLDSLACSLFSTARPGNDKASPVPEDMGFAERLVICHELASELDNDLFETIADHQRSPDVVLPQLAGLLPRFRDIVQLVCPHSKPRILFLVAQSVPESAELNSVATRSTPSSFDVLEGFDTVGGIVSIEELLDPYFERKMMTPSEVPIRASQDSDVVAWRTANEVASMFVVPIRVVCEHGLETAGLLVLILSRECDVHVSAAVKSVFRRFAHLCHTTFDIAQSVEPIEQRRKPK